MNANAAADPRFATVRAKESNWAALREIIEGWTSQRRNEARPLLATLGQHTHEVLHEVLRCGPAELHALSARGVFGTIVASAASPSDAEKVNV